MTLALLFLMAYNPIDDATHELIKTAIIVLFIALTENGKKCF